MTTMFERFTDRTRRVIVISQEITRLWRDTEIEPRHVLAAIIHERENLAAKALLSVGVDGNLFLREENSNPERTNPNNPFSQETKDALYRANSIASFLNVNYVAPEHLLCALLEGVILSDRLMKKIGIAKMLDLWETLMRVEEEGITDPPTPDESLSLRIVNWSKLDQEWIKVDVEIAPFRAVVSRFLVRAYRESGEYKTWTWRHWRDDLSAPSAFVTDAEVSILDKLVADHPVLPGLLALIDNASAREREDRA